MQPEASVGCNFVKTQKTSHSRGGDLALEQKTSQSRGGDLALEQKTSQSSGGDLALEQKSYKNVKPNGKKTTEIQSPEKNEQNV